MSLPATVNFPFSADKAAQAAAVFIEHAGGRLNVLKLVKLLYLQDRESLKRRGIPVIGGHYFSLQHGPVTEEALDLINGGFEGPHTVWSECITDREDHLVVIKSDPPTDLLSKSELEMIEQLHRAHADKDQWELRDWCHLNCGEWAPTLDGRREIKLREIAENTGASGDDLEEAASEAQLFSRVFA